MDWACYLAEALEAGLKEEGAHRVAEFVDAFACEGRKFEALHLVLDALRQRRVERGALGLDGIVFQLPLDLSQFKQRREYLLLGEPDVLAFHRIEESPSVLVMSMYAKKTAR